MINSNYNGNKSTDGVKRLAKDILYTYRMRLSILLVMTVIAFSTVAVSHGIFGEAISFMQSEIENTGTVVESDLLWWFGLIVSYACIRGLFLYATALFRMITVQHILHFLRSRLFTTIQSMELDWHHKHGTGELVTRSTRDCDMVRGAVEAAFQVIEIGSMLCGSILLLFYYNWQLALPPFLLMFIAVRMYINQAKILVRMNRATDDAYDHVTQDIAEGVEGVRVVKAFALEKTRAKVFSMHVDTFIGHGLRALTYAVTRIPLPQFILSLTHPWVVFFGIVLIARAEPIMSGEPFKVGYLISALMAMTNIIFRLDGVGSAMRMLSEAVASMQRLSEVVYSEPNITSGSIRLPKAPAEKTSLTLNNISAHDNTGSVILSNVSFCIQPREIVALVGSTGSGKSVLCSLLPALKSYSQGSISMQSATMGAQSIDDIDHHDLRSCIHVVPQESFLFSESIAGNLRIARKDATDEDLWRALEDAGIKGFIETLPDALNTKVGERGMTLSGGQKQRLCLARALLAEPQILVLDDSTSALDAITEQRIFARLRSGDRRSAVLLVTTRLSSILLADRVMMLADGMIVADATHAELAAHNTQYQELLCLAEHGESESAHE